MLFLPIASPQMLLLILKTVSIESLPLIIFKKLISVSMMYDTELYLLLKTIDFRNF